MIPIKTAAVTFCGRPRPERDTKNTVLKRRLLYCKQRGHVKIQSCRMQCMQWWCGVLLLWSSLFLPGCASFLLLLFDFSFDFSDVIMIFPMSHLHDGKCLETEMKHTKVHQVTVELKTSDIYDNIFMLLRQQRKPF